MVRNGQRRHGTIAGSGRAAPIEPVPFSNPQHPGLGIEVLSLAQLRERVPARHRHTRSRPDFHQLMLVESGSTEHEIDFERHRCRGGGVLYLRPGQVQCFVRQAGAQGWVLLFRPDFLPHEPLLEARLGPASAVSFSLAAGERRCIGLAVPALAEAYGAIDGDAAWPRVLQQLLLAVLLQVARAQEEAGSSAGAQAPGMLRVYRRFVQELEHAFGHTREVAWFAQRIGCSTKTLSRACEALAGASPKRVIERRVALEAKRLLAHSTLAVSAIGLELGFSEPTNFVKFFRRCEGITPAAFREGAAPG